MTESTSTSTSQRPAKNFKKSKILKSVRLVEGEALRLRVVLQYYASYLAREVEKIPSCTW